MELKEIFNTADPAHWLQWEEKGFVVSTSPSKHSEANRETLAQLYAACITKVQQLPDFDINEANIIVRSLWTKEAWKKCPKNFPCIFGDDGFLRMYVLGEPLSVALFRRLWQHLSSPQKKVVNLNPIHVEWNQQTETFFDIDATPPGFLPKLYSAWRLKKDEELLQKIAHDFELISHIEDNHRRTLLTMAVLSHGAAYRELEGKVLKIPSFQEPRRLIAYICYQHLVAEGVKTISLEPTAKGIPGIYACQGTELWPSQPSVLGSILANFATHGSATEAYAHSWRRIHKHLRDLKKEKGPYPLVCGHSMGGALAMQIGLYSHGLIEKIYAFNPPVPNERDYAFYKQMSKKLQRNISVIANLDDFAFWRIGAKVIGNVTLFLGKKRWRYYHVSIWDCLLIFPAFVKFILNVRHAFPAHQCIVGLSDSYLWLELTEEEIDRENAERTHRFDYLHFFPKLYDPVKTLLHFFRKIFGWSMEEAYIGSEIEVIALHEQDLIDALTDENEEEIESQLEELKKQKERLQKRLQRIRLYTKNTSGST